jgi:hypothetical protein
MAIFAFDVESVMFGEQEFLIEADDLIDAHMKAIDFAKQVDENILARYDVEASSEVVKIFKTTAKQADDAGAAEYLDELELYVEED